MGALVLSWVGSTVLLIAVVGFVSSALHPRPRAIGDSDLVAELERLCSRRTRRLAACVIERGEHPSTRSAFMHAEATTRFEIGSVTKALTGLLLAGAVDRGEVTLDTQVGEVIAEVRGTGLGEVTLRELCTHTSGLPRLALTAAAIPRLLLYGLLGLDPYRGTSTQGLLSTAARQRLRNRGQSRYSNLGGAVLGQVLARAAGGDFPGLLDERLFNPLGMDGAGVSAPGATASWGWSSLGLPRMPWILGGYAPAGGVFATLPDLAVLAERLLDGTAPGLSAISPLAAQGDLRQVGMFWVIDTVHRARTGEMARLRQARAVNLQRLGPGPLTRRRLPLLLQGPTMLASLSREQRCARAARRRLRARNHLSRSRVKAPALLG